MIRTKIQKVLNVLRGIDRVDLEAYRKAGLNIGKDCKIQNGVQLDFNHCQHIYIGNNVTIAPRAYILAHDASTMNYLGYAKIGKVRIGDNVFIGACALIMPGVSIGENSIVGAGSVVVSDIPARVVVAGNPARIICSLEDFLAKRKTEFDKYPRFSEAYTRRNKVDEAERKRLNDEMNDRMNDNWGFIE